jgi:hypothetical protein
MSTVVEPIIQEVADNLDEVAAATRTLNAATLGSFSFGVVAGVAAGFYFGYRYNKKKLHAEALEYAEEEIKTATSEMAEHYRNKELALADQTKEPVEEIIKEKGYSLEDLRTDTVRPAVEARLPKPPVPILTTPTNSHIWDYTKENANRNPRLPYVIHKDEFDQFDMYENVSYAWYPIDEVLMDTQDNSVITNVAGLVGAENLERFGHGSGDPNVVFVRNNELRLQIEIVREPDKSYEEEVFGLDAVDDSPS